MVTISESGTAVSGDILKLTCTVDVSIPPVVQWIDPNNTVITNTTFITVGPPLRAGNITNLTLIFEPLVTSHGGQYTCQSDVDAASSARYSTSNVTVQSELVDLICTACVSTVWVCDCMYFFLLVAPPSLSISREQIEDSLIVNQNLTLTCTALPSQYVDTSVAVQFIWTSDKEACFIGL